MEERKLNLNAPLLSVRRNLSSASTNSSSLLKGRSDKTSIPRNQQPIFVSRNVDWSMDPVTETVSVPFVWEDVPGKAKDDCEPELLPLEEIPPPITLIVARNSSSIHDDCSEKELRERSQMEKGSVSDENERYSDAVDTLSPTNSFSVSYSISSLSESDGAVMKSSGTFSIDKQTRDFMMGRFLPAARAMAIASESSLHHATRKPQSLLTEHHKEGDKQRLFATESGTLSRQHHTEIVNYCTQALRQTETSEEEEEEEGGDDDHSEYSVVGEKGCGVLPQLPVPGLKSKIKNLMPFIPAIRKDTKVKSADQSVLKGGRSRPKSEHRVETSKLDVVEIKPPGGAFRRSFSGELQRLGKLSPFSSRRNDVSVSGKREGPQPAYTAPPPPLGGLRRLSLSGELKPTRKLSPFRSSRNDNESPRPPQVMPSFGRSIQHNFSGELRTTGRQSSFRPSSIDRVSPEEIESPRSYTVPMLRRASQRNFSGELLTTSRLSPFQTSRNDAVTAEITLQKTSRLSPYRPQRNDVKNPEKDESPRASYGVQPLGGLNRRNFSGELRMAGPLSPFMPSRDVTVLEKEESPQASNAMLPLGWPGQHNLSGETQVPHRKSPLRLRGNHESTLQRGERKGVPAANKSNRCIRPASPAAERTLYVDTVARGRDWSSNLETLDCEVWIDPGVSREVEETATGKTSFQDIECLDSVSGDRKPEEAHDYDGVVDPLSLPLPLLKSPSESWLWHALPSKSDRSPFSSLQKTALPSSKHVPDPHGPEAKWETIVKTSKTQHGHTRYSKELIEHVPRQY